MVPSMTDTSLWHSPAWWMRTLTSCGRGSRTSTSSRTSSSPVHTTAFMLMLGSGRCSLVRPQDVAGQAGVVLQLAVEHDRHAVDDGGLRALGLGRPPSGAVRE